jgi:hypothetical protein
MADRPIQILTKRNQRFQGVPGLEWPKPPRAQAFATGPACRTGVAGNPAVKIFMTDRPFRKLTRSNPFRPRVVNVELLRFEYEFRAPPPRRKRRRNPVRRDRPEEGGHRM